MSGVGLKYSSWNAKVIQPKWALPSSINLYPPNTSVDYSSPTYSQSPPQEILIRIPPFLLLIITYKTSQKNRIMFVHDRSKICIFEYEQKLVDTLFDTKKKGKKKKETLDACESRRIYSWKGVVGITNSSQKVPTFQYLSESLNPLWESGEAESKLSGPGLKGHVNGPIAGGKGGGRIRWPNFTSIPLHTNDRIME